MIDGGMDGYSCQWFLVGLCSCYLKQRSQLFEVFIFYGFVKRSVKTPRKLDVVVLT